MKYLLAFILILLLLICAGVVHAATQIQRVVDGNQIRLVYLVEADHEPRITTGDEYVTSRALVQDGQQWRLTINATLPLCSGELAIDGATVTKQRCVYMPIGAK